MAILLNPLLGQISGRIGELVFYNYRGKTCARRRHWKQNSPATEPQRQQRSRMRAACIFYQALVAAGLKKAWNKAAEGSLLSGYNLFTRLNIQVFSGQGLITDFSRVRLVTGSLPLPDMLEVKRLSPTTLGVKWQLKARCNHKRLSDGLVLAFMKSEGGIHRACDGSWRSLPFRLRSPDRTAGVAGSLSALLLLFQVGANR